MLDSERELSLRGKCGEPSFFLSFSFFLNRESVSEKGESREGESREGGNCNVTGDWDESCRVPLDVYQE